MNPFTRLLKWAERNERHLGAVLFIFGFVTDLFTFVLLPVALVNLAFLGYLALAAAATLASHLFSGPHEHQALWRRIVAVVSPLAAQYAIGSLLSGCLIFYAKSAAIIVSWPFLLMLALVFIGNEYFRTYYKHLAFQLVLFFFGIYAYAIFALPLLVNALGPWVFIGSTVASLLVFALFLYALVRLRRREALGSLRYVVPATVLIVLLMNVSYFSGLVPPIPLTLPSATVAHSLARSGGEYVLTTEGERPWWDLRTPVIHHVPGTPLYAFSSVSAPISFGTSIMHVWEYRDPNGDGWVERSRFAFPIAGGREKGYRGYSEVSDPQSGRWRVTIETVSGQVIGRLYFIVENADTEPPLQQEVK